ncbi:hypothetical protein FPV67DRAFT_1789231 [Lyophyllum atratum]|nr:hypothetical protein FPV67DRAFT_1789231 [Lyophyllum atratum]
MATVKAFIAQSLGLRLSLEGRHIFRHPQHRQPPPQCRDRTLYPIKAVTNKDMLWFDSKMGAEVDTTVAGDQGPLGARGLMARFTRWRGRYRLVQLLKYLTTTITCLVLSFVGPWGPHPPSPRILSAAPLLILIQAFSQATASPPPHTERIPTANAAGLIDGATGSIATVKASKVAAAALTPVP